MKEYYFTCPKCGQRRHFFKPSREPDRLGLWMALESPLLAHASASRKGSEIQCGECHHLFCQPALPSSDGKKLALWVCCTLFVSVLSALLLIPIAFMLDPILDRPWVEVVESMIVAYPGIVFFVTFLTIAVLLIICIVGSVTSNRRHHRQLSDRFETSAKRWSLSENEDYAEGHTPKV